MPRTRLATTGTYATSMRIAGTWVTLGKSKAEKRGILKLPTMRFDKAGRYPIKVSTSGAPDRFLTLVVTKRP
ncbi:MAG: hypothetical protein Q7L55_08415 [Actinomycetota bacterium]|nr:hypothetical protein [Actinomycetota bacterium]